MYETKIYSDLDSVAQYAANEFVDKLESLSGSSDPMNIMLTGGSLGIRMLEKASASSKLHSISLDLLNLWWGDERFLPSQHPDRNALQARKALVDSLNLNAEQIHEFPAADVGLNLDQAAAEFSEYFLKLAPSFDLVLLGVGPDGHVASLFPGHDAAKTNQTIIAEHSSPKPPSERLSFNYEVLNSAAEVWFLVAGIEKSEVVAEVLAEEVSSNLPAARVFGRNRTVWFLDEAAASLRI